MSRINTNISSMNAIHQMIANQTELTVRLQRLSSGLRINSGKDDPAGLIASENLRSEMKGLSTAVDNSIRASSVIATAEGALNEISSLLIDIKGLLVTSANKGALSDEEIDANQLQVDSAINSIQRMANATEFQGVKLLNGNRAYTTSSVNTTYVADLAVNAAKLVDGATMAVNVRMTTSAQTGLVRLSGNGTSGTVPLTIKVGSNRGSTELSFAGSTATSAIVYAINQVREITGVSAALSGTVAANLYSVDFGTDAYVSVQILSGEDSDTLQIKAPGGTHATTTKDYGVNAVANVNGTAATASGKKLTIRTSMLDAELDLTTAQAQASNWSTTFGITSGGSNFAIGARVDAVGMESIAFMDVSPNQLGDATDGYLNTLKSGMSNALDGDNVYTAQRIIDNAIKDISKLRGRLGAFQRNVLDRNVNSLRVTLENVTASESAIRDADFSTETAALTRAQILVQANTSVLSLANSMPQSVLALLG